MATKRLREITAELATTIPSLISEHDLPGVSIGVTSLREGTWVAGFGTTKRGGGRPVNGDTTFSVQSISKTYTAVVVMTAVRAGLVDLDEPVTTYLPDFAVGSRHEPRPQDRMTLRHLLAHKAGFTHEAPVGNNWRVGDETFDEHVASIGRTWLRYPVGERYEYSNLGIDLAPHIVSVVTGRPFESFAADEIFAPLGMRRTTFDLPTIRRTRNRALGHSPGYDAMPVKVPMVAAGGLYTSARDVSRFIRFHLERGDEVQDMYEVPFPAPGQAAGYGLGIAVIDRGGLRYLGHSGGGFGFLADMYWLPEHGVGAVVLTNSTSHTILGQRTFELIESIAGVSMEPREEVAEVAVPVGKLRNLTGNYVGRGFAVDVELRDGHLGVALGDTFSPLRMTSSVEAEVALGATVRVRFELDSAGRPRYAVLLNDGTTINYNREPGGSPRAEWDEWIGEYVDIVFGVENERRRIWVENGQLCFGPWGGAARLPLTEHEPGLLFSAPGEAMDLRQPTATYANVRLHRL